MVVGNGMVANNFYQYQKREDIVIFASGVSNSKSTNEIDFNREKELLTKITNENKDKKIVYFSTFNLYDPAEKTSAYCQHKLKMEEFITQNIPNYNIFRLGHVAGNSAKQYTILSFINNSIINGTSFKLWKYATRNIIDIEDIVKICSYIIEHSLYVNEITNVCNSINTSILDLVQIFEQTLNMKGIYEIVEKGGAPEFDNSKIELIATNLGINFDNTYTQKVIVKYFMVN